MASKKNICLIVPSLKAGGMERVMAEIANFLSIDKNLVIHLILFDDAPAFYDIDKSVRIYRPSFKAGNRVSLIIRTHKYLRSILKKIEPLSVLSFGSMYNSFVLLASIGIDTKIFVSDRSNPYRNTRLTFKKNEIERHDGIHHYLLKKLLYKRADGILVQTEKARQIEYSYSGHSNIILFPNPIRDIEHFPGVKKEKWILNVGRFIKTKNQSLLIEMFSELKIYNDGWKLVFAGDGPEMQRAKKLVKKKQLSDSVFFVGNVKDIDKYYRKSEIFAFASVSEGFPNSLGEALKASLACISFNCVAGPSDLIEDSENGFLVPVNDKKEFKEKLRIITKDERVRRKFQENALSSMQDFDREVILKKIKTILTEK